MSKRKLTNAALLLVFFLGLALVLYPSLANWYNSRHTSRLIATYTQEVSALDDAQYAEQMEDAQRFNEKLEDVHEFTLPTELLAEYSSVLDVSGVGVMGYVEIPGLNVTLPIYHGTSEGVLQIAVGHLEWTNLPIGGLGTHCVLSGHRGLPSAKLFSDLPQMAVGDVFYIHVLNERLTYEVDQILTVLPSETDDLQPVAGKDYCTLMTCTPYGINSHRLLVRGHRVANAPEEQLISVPADAVRVEPLVIAPLLALPILLFLLILVLVRSRRK